MRRGSDAPAHLIPGSARVPTFCSAQVAQPSSKPIYSSRSHLYRPAMTVPHPQSILIVDFGSQVTQLIARRVREAGVYCEIAPFNTSGEAFERLKPRGVIFSGGPQSVTSTDSPRAPQAMFDSGVPLLGIC